MRKRIENQIRKAVRIASHLEPSFAQRCMRTERTGQTIEEALVSMTADRSAPTTERGMAAELLALARHPDPYRPLIEHFLDCNGTIA
jgi:hypothetical protein